MSYLRIYEEERARAAELFGKPELRAVPLVINGRLRRAMARTKWPNRFNLAIVRVELSGDMRAAPEKILRESFRHEFAHVAAGPHAGHGSSWQMCAIKVGADPRPICSAVRMVEARIGYKCAECGRPVMVRPHSRAAKVGGWGYTSRCHGARIVRDAALDRERATIFEEDRIPA